MNFTRDTNWPLWVSITFFVFALAIVCGRGEVMATEDKSELYFISVPVVSVFADIYDDSERETQVLWGEPVYVVNETEDGLWKEVVVPNQYREPEGYPGWINGRYLTKDASSCVNLPKLDTCAQPVLRPWSLEDSGHALLVVSPQAYIYACPDKKSAVKGRVFASSILSLRNLQPVQGNDGHSYWNIKWPHSESGLYLPYQAGSREVLPSQGKSLLQTARRFKGVAYLWGGLTCHGIDCSGLVYISCKLHGLIVPRDADQQFAVGLPISRDELEAGDLVFFGKDEDHVVHVGFYVGNGQFWDASGKHGVGLSSLDSGSYSAKYRFLGGRRYFEE